MPPKPDAAFWIKKLTLSPHPEGGFYRETYRASGTIHPCCRKERPTGMRAYSTAIYYLLQAGNFSALHRLSADEVWHHYQGGQVLIHVLSPQGEYSIMRLGTAGDPTESPQVQVPAGHWFGACPGKGVAYALMGCTVAPGFDFDDFELADRVRLSAQFPQHKSMIERFTR